MNLDDLDGQMKSAGAANEAPNLSEAECSLIATSIHNEIVGLGETTIRQLRSDVLISPERYVEELKAFQEWMELAHANRTIPAIVRAQVMTELYVAFVWLRDSLMSPIAAVLPEGSVFFRVDKFLRSGARRSLRNAIAHGNWCYLPDFSGLEYWDGPPRGNSHQRFELDNAELDRWQLLSRGSAIAALLAFNEAHP